MPPRTGPDGSPHQFGARVVGPDRPDPWPAVVSVALRRVPEDVYPSLQSEVENAGGEVLPGPSDGYLVGGAFAVYGIWESAAEEPTVRAIAGEVGRALRAYVRHGTRTVRAAHRTFVVGDRPRVLGVVNVTPDSFSDGGQFFEPATAVAQAQRLVDEGADLLDIGGESTRPGATPVSPEAEWRRVEPVLRGLAGRVAVPISIDTRHAEVAERAVDAGADVVNDVEGLRSDAMRAAVARTGAAAIVMHMRGTPATMQGDVTYADLRGEVYGWLADRLDAAHADGIEADRLLVDPGLGFGKSPEQSLELLAHAREFRGLGPPVVIGASRKSFLGKLTGGTTPGERLEAGLAAAVLAAAQGVELVRAHDVRPTVRALSVVAAMRPPTD